MKLEQFKLDCKRTCPTLNDGLAVDLSHMVLGMDSEIVELRMAVKNKDKVNIAEELADFMWYFCNYLTFRNLPIPLQLELRLVSKSKTNECINHLYDFVSLLQDHTKKLLAYGKPINIHEEEDNLILIYNTILRIVKVQKLDLEDALDKNIAKLKLRYPDKFDADKAINRDVQAERKILEGEVK